MGINKPPNRDIALGIKALCDIGDKAALFSQESSRSFQAFAFNIRTLFQNIQTYDAKLADFSLKLFKAMEPAATAFKSFQSGLAKWNESFNIISHRWGALGEALSKSSRLFVEIHKEYNKANLFLLEHGWPPLMHLDIRLPIQLMNTCSRNNWSDVESRQYVARRILSYYNKDAIKNILAEWNNKEALKSRRHLITPAINAHLDGEYALSVPAMIIQIEGLIVAHFGHQGYMGQKRYKEYIQQLFDGPEYLLSSSDIAKRFMLEVVLSNFQHGDDLEGDHLKRHAILHGAHTAYDQKTTSLKCILLLDLIADQLNYISLENSGVFHHSGCRALIKTKQKRQYFSDPVHAQNQNKRPCNICVKRSSD